MMIEEIDAILEGIAPVVIDLISQQVSASIKTMPAAKDGAPGTSAYQIACFGGFSGTEAQWLESLRGKDATVDVSAIVAAVVSKIPEPKPGDPGKDAEVDYARVAEIVNGSVSVAVAALPEAKAGKDADQVDVAAIIAEVTAKIPAPIPGKDAEVDYARLREMVKESVVAAVPATVHKVGVKLVERVDAAIAGIPAPVNGKDADPEVIRAQVSAAVAVAVAAIPTVKGDPGTSVTVEELRVMFEAEQAKWALEWERRAGDHLQRAIDRMPKPKDGHDAFDLEDFDVVLGEDGRTLSLKFVRGDVVKERQINIPSIQDTGVYRAERQYVKGDGATWDGSFWTAQKDTRDKPGTSDTWRLAVKKGRDGKSYEPTPAPPSPVRLK